LIPKAKAIEGGAEQNLPLASGRVSVSLLRSIKALPGYEYGNGFAYTPYVVMWQLGEFKEQRALDDLWRIAACDPRAALDPCAGYGPHRMRELTILFAEDAILKILCQEAPDPIGKQWPYEGLGKPIPD
jgi:hypothetical protein